MDNQISQIIAHLKRYGHITSIEAFTWYGATRLSSIIFKLRGRGWNIETVMTEGKNRFGGACRYAVYNLISEPDTEGK